MQLKADSLKNFEIWEPRWMVNPPLCQVHWYENFPKYFSEEVHLKILPFFFSTKNIQKTGQNDDISCPFQKKTSG